MGRDDEKKHVEDKTMRICGIIRSSLSFLIENKH